MALRLALLQAHRAGLRDPGVVHEFDQTVWTQAKKILKSETSGKCAYCEAPTASVAYGDVEHYRPKSIYWWLAYSPENYLYSCQICNQTHKRDSFPIHGKGLGIDPPLPNPFPEQIDAADLRRMATGLAPDPFDDLWGYPIAKFRSAAVKEKAGIVDPYLVDLEPLFKWVVDDINREIRIRARSRAVASARAYQAAERFLGLNREELRRQRYEIYEFARILDLSLSALGGSALGTTVSARLRRMIEPESPFAGMVRYFVNDVWKTRLE